MGAASLRTALATSESTDTPLTWLNEILEVASKQAGDYTFIFRNLLTVLTKCRTMSTQLTSSWLLELMGQISALLRKAGPMKPAGPAIPFLLDVFNLAVIVLTETDSLVVPRDQICVSRASRLSLLSLSTCRLAGHVLHLLLHPLLQAHSNHGDPGLQAQGQDECGQDQQGNLWREDRKKI